MWPMKRAVKKPPIMTNVQKVRVMKFAFFFSYSAALSGFCVELEVISGDEMRFYSLLVRARVAFGTNVASWVTRIHPRWLR